MKQINTKNLILPVALMLVAILLKSCIYSPDETIYTKIQEIDFNNYNIDLTEYLQQDTLWIYERTTFSLSITPGSGNVKDVKLYWDGALNNMYPNENISFTPTNYQIRTGTHILRLETITTSGTGTIADQYGAELIQLEKSWIIVSDTDPPSDPKIEITSSNGFLALKWTPYNKPNFRNYIIEYNQVRNGKKETYIINDSTTNLWVDSAYIDGMNRHFKFSIETGNGTYIWNIYHTTSYDFNFTYDIRDSTVTVSLNPFIFSKAIDKIHLHEDNTVQLSIPKDYTGETTIKLLQPGYNLGSYIGVSASGWFNNDQSWKTAKIIYPTVDSDTLDYYDIYYYYNQNTQSYYSHGYKSIHEFTLSEIATHQYTFPKAYGKSVIPFTGDYGYYVENQKIYKVDLINRSIQQVHNGPIKAESLQASGNGIIIYYENTGTNYVYVIKNLITGNIIMQKEPNYNAYSVSEDGKYLKEGRNIYEIIDDNPIFLYSLPDVRTYEYNFFPDQPDLIWVNDNRRNLIVYDLATGEQILNKYIGDVYIDKIFYDPLKQKFILRSNYKIIVLNASDLSFFKEVRGNFAFSFFDGYLFDNGQYLKIY